MKNCMFCMYVYHWHIAFYMNNVSNLFMIVRLGSVVQIGYNHCCHLSATPNSASSSAVQQEHMSDCSIAPFASAVFQLF